MTERWKWTIVTIEEMDWSDFQAWAKGAKQMYDAERKAHEEAMKG